MLLNGRIYSEKYIVEQFPPWFNIVECTYTNLDSIAWSPHCDFLIQERDTVNMRLDEAAAS